MRNNKTIVYGSSYDRGVEHLLKMWPEIKKQVPEAKLRIFYGWDLFMVGYKDNPERMAWKDRIDGLMQQDGIIHLGRISHEAVKVEFENAGIWAYPTHFGEISCITAMKAQIYGAVPVVVAYAALKETVQHGVKIDGDIYDQETKDEFIKQVVGLLKDENKQEEIRKEMMPWAREKFTWTNVAKQWDKEFRSGLSLEKQVEELMEDNQTLKAWELVKNTEGTLKDRVWLRVKHAFNKDDYLKYYAEQLTEYPLDESVVTEIDKVYPRFAWLLKRLDEFKPSTLVDLGCADGYLCFTAAQRGIKSVGVNLYKPSINVANDRAKRLKLDAKFICQDLFDHSGKYDAAVMFEVLEHLPDARQGVEKTMSLLNENGRAYFSTPRTDHVGVELHKQEINKRHWDDGEPSGHLRLFTEEEFKDLFKGYKIIDYHLDDERCMMVEVSK